VPTVTIPPPYRGPTGGREAIEVQGTTVRECIEAVEALHPGFLGQVLDPDGRPHRFVNLFRNGDPVDPDAAVSSGDEVAVLAAIGGG
jgi:molybdopterin converting factor small subunit